MSVWDDYREDYDIANEYEPIELQGFFRKSYVDKHIENFVGTKSQIAEEEKRLTEEYNEKTKQARLKRIENVSSILDNYRDKLYSGYNLPKYVLDKAYSIAYDRGHSSGFYEVENYFDEYIDIFKEIYHYGIRVGRGTEFPDKKE